LQNLVAMHKKLLVLGIAAALVVVLGDARRAHACGSAQGGAYPILLGVGLGATTVVLTDVFMSAKDLRDKTPSHVYGGFETVFGTLQALGFGALALSSVTDRAPPADSILLGGLALWTAGLAAHGIYVVSGGYDRPGPARGPEQARRQPRLRWGAAPALLADDRKNTAPGGILYGRF
jgi:hypothetical protein